jgi:PilZ domain-containing protein
MSHNGRSVENEHRNQPPDARREGVVPMSQSPSETVSKAASRYAELQSAARFPVRLPISVKSNTGESVTETENISANGVLFQLDSAVPVGSAVDFTISLPAEIVGATADVQLQCRGRVARNFAEGSRVGVGVVIEEYQFKRGEL